MEVGYTVIFILILITIIYHYLFNKKYDCSSEPIERKYGDYIKTAHSGWIRGIIIGLLLGTLPLEAAVQNAAIFGVVNPMVMYLGY